MEDLKYYATEAVPTVRATAAFHPINDATALAKAMKGVGTDEAAVIDVLTRRSNSQRQEVREAYETKYGKDLSKELRKELKGHLEDTILALLHPTDVYLAHELKRAMKGAGTDEKALSEVLCTRSNFGIKRLKSVYEDVFDDKLEDDLRKELSGNLELLFLTVCKAERQETNVENVSPLDLANQLYDCGEKIRGTDEEKIIGILTKYSYVVLRDAFKEYRKVSEKTFEEALKSEFKGPLRDALLAIYRCIDDRAKYFAEELHCAMRGVGTKEGVLTRIVVSRSEVDLGNIKEKYLEMYGETLAKTVKEDTKGDYEKVLLKLIN